MGYSGRPSKACQECRLRRTKCDYKTPSCSQCIRAKRRCRGYRDPDDLIIRDELEGLISRQLRLVEMKARKASRAESNETASLSGSNLDLTVQTAMWRAASPAPVPGLGPSVDDQALSFFFSNYDFHTKSATGDTVDYVAHAHRTGQVGSALSDSVAALGMIGLANFWKDPNLDFRGRLRYSSAMKTLSSQLRNLKDAKSDEAMMTTMLLCFYETHTCNTPQSLDAWTKHVQGATAMLQLRGKEQLRTPMGHHLFVSLRTQVITNCAQRRYRIPQIVIDCNDSLDFEDVYQASATRLAALIMKFCNLRASMPSSRDPSQLQPILDSACALDAEFEEWVKAVPPQYDYQTVTLTKRSDEVFSYYYHTYSGLWVITGWNHYRSIRIQLNALILDQLIHFSTLSSPFPTSDSTTTTTASTTSPSRINDPLASPSQITPQILKSHATILHLCHEICASVPYSLNFNPNLPPYIKRNPPIKSFLVLLLSPLFTAGCTKWISELMRKWIVERFKWMAGWGIGNAEALGGIVERKIGRGEGGKLMDVIRGVGVGVGTGREIEREEGNGREGLREGNMRVEECEGESVEAGKDETRITELEVEPESGVAECRKNGNW